MGEAYIRPKFYFAYFLINVIFSVISTGIFALTAIHLISLSNTVNHVIWVAGLITLFLCVISIVLCFFTQFSFIRWILVIGLMSNVLISGLFTLVGCNSWDWRWAECFESEGVHFGI